MIQIYVTDSSPLCEELFLQKIYDTLPKERKAKADACKVPKKRRQSIAAGWLLKESLHRFPKSVEQASFNLSHSGRLAACAIGEQPVGVDLEQVRPLREKLVEACFTEREKRKLQENPEKKDELFTRFWTQKESAAKLTHEGIKRILARKNREEEPTIFTKSFSLKLGEEKYYLTVASYEKELPQTYQMICIREEQKYG